MSSERCERHGWPAQTGGCCGARSECTARRSGRSGSCSRGRGRCRSCDDPPTPNSPRAEGWRERIVPRGTVACALGPSGWLQSLPEAEPANYGDTKARVKEKGGESACLRLRGRADPLWVGESSAVFLDPQGTRRYDSPGHVRDRLREAILRADRDFPRCAWVGNWDREGKIAAPRNPINGYRLFKRADLEPPIVVRQP